MRLYVETSVVSFWFDRQARNREKVRATRRLLLLCRREAHQGFISDLVLEEIGDSREPFRSRDLKLISRVRLLEALFDRQIYTRLFEAYLREPDLGRLPETDLRHIALFSASDLDALVTFNLRHIANQIILEVVRKVNHAQGISRELRIAPPEAFLPPGTA